MSLASNLPTPVRRAVMRASRGVVRLTRYKDRSELAFWIDHWDKHIRDGHLWGENSLELSGDSEVAAEYEERRWQQARAEVNRVLQEAKIEDKNFFDGKVVLDIGPGCVGFPDAVAVPAKLSFGVDPIAEAYRDSGLLIDSDAIYLNTPAERIPLLSESVDVIVCRNSLDHVDKPTTVVAEIHRLLRPGGTLILNVDIDHPASPTEPHEISIGTLRGWLQDFTVELEDEWLHGHAGEDVPGHAVVVRATRP
ncbi:MAG: class I SAM-dependent methyltransferase [Thermoleophilaceae bacterium]|nr:class I SAM-dependent methyltransferase [Thermoleophilaceae bacterium]